MRHFVSIFFMMSLAASLLLTLNASTAACAQAVLDVSGSELLPPREIRPPAGYDLSAVYTAPLASPWDMVFTPSGDILVAELGLPRIRRVTLDGEISTFTLLPHSFPAIAYNAGGELFVGGGEVLKVSQDGKLTPFCKTILTKMVLGPDGAFYAIDWGGSPDVKKITTEGNVSTYATGLSHASDIAFSPTGELYVMDAGSRRIVKVNADGRLATVTTGFQTDYGVIAFDKEGHLFYFGWWADEKSWAGYGIFKISISDRSVTPFVLDFYWGACSDFEIDDSGNIFGIGPTLGVLFKVSPDGKVAFVVEAWYNNRGLTVGPSGDLFIADIGSLCPLLPGKILRVGIDGNCSVFFDGLHQPRSLTFDASGNLFVADRDGLLKISSEDEMRVVTSEPGLMSIAFDQVSGHIFGFQCFPLQERQPRLLRIHPDGNVSALPVVFNRDVYDGNLAVDSDGNILVAVTYAENINVGPLSSELLKISTEGEVKVLAELVEYVPTWTCSLATGPSGDIYVLDHPSLKEEPSGFVIWKVTSRGNVSLFADRLPTDPFSIAVNSEGDVFFTCGIGIYRIFAVEDGIVIDGLKDDWEELSPMIVDPDGDWNGLETDIKAVYGFTDDKSMYLMVEFYQFTDIRLDSLNVEVDFNGDGRAEYLCIFTSRWSYTDGVTVLITDLREGESSWTWQRRGLSYVCEVAEMKMPLSYIENRKDFSLRVVVIGRSDGEHFHVDGTDWARVSTFIDHVITADGIAFHVTTESNSVISDFQFIKDDKKLVFDVTGPAGTRGFCNITIPNRLLGGPFQITSDGQPLSEVVSLDNGTQTWLCFTYLQSGHRIEIIATTVIPEFPSILLPVLWVAITLFASVFEKKFKMPLTRYVPFPGDRSMIAGYSRTPRFMFASQVKSWKKRFDRSKGHVQKKKE